MQFSKLDQKALLIIWFITSDYQKAFKNKIKNNNCIGMKPAWPDF